MALQLQDTSLALVSYALLAQLGEPVNKDTVVVGSIPTQSARPYGLKSLPAVVVE